MFCNTCKYLKQMSKSAYHCFRYPIPATVTPEHYCGEHIPGSPQLIAKPIITADVAINESVTAVAKVTKQPPKRKVKPAVKKVVKKVVKKTKAK